MKSEDDMFDVASDETVDLPKSGTGAVVGLCLPLV